MGDRFRSWWQIIRQHPFITSEIIVVLFALSAFAFAVIKFGWDWTGFNGGYSKITTHTPAKDTELPSVRTLWDWLGLIAALAIPIVVGFGVAWFTTQQGKVSAAENMDNQRETALQAYIDKMSELLLHENLRESTEEKEVRKIARVRTLSVLRRLDGERKASVLKFLYESDLINKDKPIINLVEADLSKANLIVADLSEADLSEAHLFKADLNSVYLNNANLREVNLTKHYSRTSLSQLLKGNCSPCLQLASSTLSRCHVS